MNTVTAPASVGDIESFITLLRAACGDQAMRVQLQRILACPAQQRSALVRALVCDLQAAGAPHSFVQAVACLRDDGVASRTDELMRQADRAERSMRRAAALVLFCLLALLLVMLAPVAWRHLASVGACGRADAAAIAGRHEEAVAGYSACLDQWFLADDARVNALNGRSLAYTRTGDFAPAATDLQAMHAIAPPTSHAQFARLAEALLRAESLTARVPALEQMKRLSTAQQRPSAEFQLGWTLHRIGRHEDAVASLTAFIGLRPQSAVAHWFRGLSLEALGRRDEAKQDFAACAARLDARQLGRDTVTRLLPAIRVKLHDYGLPALPAQ